MISEEDKKRIDANCSKYIYDFAHATIAHDIAKAYKIAATNELELAQSRESLLKEEVERLKNELYWEKERQIEANANQVSCAVADAIQELHLWTPIRIFRSFHNYIRNGSTNSVVRRKGR